jgi:hypothetical protein
MEDAMEFASAGQTPYTPAQVLSIAYQSIFRTGIFVDDCKIWKRRDEIYKTWEHFKRDFRVSYTEYVETLDTTPQASGFHAEAAGFHAEQREQQESTIEAIANLATATAEDRTAVATLTKTNAALTYSLAKSGEKLIAAMAQITNLTKQLADLKANKRGTRVNEPTPDLVPGKYHYCWTCGYKCDHPSFKCTVQATGHDKGATKNNTKNGSVVNKPANV